MHRGSKYQESSQVPRDVKLPREAPSTQNGGKYQERRQVPRDTALPRESASFKRCGRPYQERPQYSNKLHGQMHHARPGFYFFNS